MKTISENTLVYICLGIIAYFGLIWLLFFFSISSEIIGVFVELLTLPFFSAQIIFSIYGINYLRKHKTSKTTKLSVSLLIICTVLTIISVW